MRIAQRRTVGFNLSFLDIMACGLGAIILLFMLVKEQANAPSAELEMLQADLAAMRGELRELEDAARELTSRIEILRRDLQSELAGAAKSNAAAGDAAGEIIKLAKEIARLEREKAKQRRRIEEAAPAGDSGAEEHLLGLKVRGPLIVILLDSSASMADERLVDIIKIKAQGTAAKRAAPKWRRALAAANWIIRRVPEDSRYRVIHYNAAAEFLSDNWLRGDDDAARERMRGKLAELYPHGATNLHQALKLVAVNKLAPTDIYVITDSLPTKGNLPAVERFRRCGTEKNNVSGECRLALMYRAIKSFPSITARINTVLLPLEGDPEAAYAYWVWAASTTGVMVGPENAWP
ncbi:MAG: VWA domain-containing protein [Gammaproteobacteria bacterium]